MATKFTRRVQRLAAGNNTSLKTVVLTSAGAQTTGTDNHLQFVIPEGGTYYSTVVRLETVNTGATFIVDVNKNGTTVFTTQANRPTIAIGAATKQSTTAAAPEITSFAAGDVVKFDIDQIGSTVAGSDLSITFSYLANDV